MSILDLKPNESAVVRRIADQGPIRRRLIDMGILPRVEISLERIAPSGDPIWIRIGSVHLALRKAEAQTVKIERTSQGLD